MINVLGVGAGIREGGQGTLGRQGRQEEVSGWSGCYRQRTAAQRTQVLGQHQSTETARLYSEKHVVPLRFGCGVCFCFDGGLILYLSLTWNLLYSSRWLELVIILLPRSPECWD